MEKTTNPLQAPRIKPNLPLLTTPKTSDKNGNTTTTNIRIATQGYTNPDGTPMSEADQITPEWITECSDQIKRRCDKAKEEQTKRTKKNAEVFTPLPTVKHMIDAAENNMEIDPTQPEWKQRITSRTLEIACGEGPFITSRYDPITGEPVEEQDRVGMLDRKLRLLKDRDYLTIEWKLEYLYIALQQTYGVEYQGDNLLIARANVFLTWYEAFEAVIGSAPIKGACIVACEIITNTITQADFLTGLLPTTTDQISLLAVYEDSELKEYAHPYYDTAQAQEQAKKKQPRRRRKKTAARRPRAKQTT